MTLTIVRYTDVIENTRTPGEGEPRQWFSSRELAQDAIDLGLVSLGLQNRHDSDVWDLWAVVER